MQRANCQLAAKGDADVAMEVSIPDRSKSTGAVPQTALIPPLTRRYSSGLLDFAAYSPRNSQRRRRSRSACLQQTDRRDLFEYIKADLARRSRPAAVTIHNRSSGKQATLSPTRNGSRGGRGASGVASDYPVMCYRGGRDGPLHGGIMTAAGRRLPGRRRPRRPAGLRTPGTDRRAWLARSIPGLCWRQRL